jgi:hypothetical protein
MANFKDLTLPNKIAISIIGIFFGGIMLTAFIMDAFDIYPYDGLAIAKVNRVERSHNPKNRATYVRYSFSVNGKTYEDHYDAQVLFQKLDTLNGKYFPVAYHSNNPSSSFLLVTPYNFKKCHQPYPDSLKWVCEFVWCE